MVLATVSGARAAGRATGRAMVDVDVADGTGHLQGDVLQPAVAGQAARAGTEVVVLRQGRRVTGAAPDDQPGGRPRRRPDRPDRAGLPAVRKAGLTTWELAELVDEALAAGRRLRRPAAPRVRAELDLVDRRDGVHGIHTPESMDATSSRRGAGWPSTSCCASSSRWCCASGRLERDGRHPPRASAATAASARFLDRLPSS